jgi:predicted nucleotidyltransferase
MTPLHPYLLTIKSLCEKHKVKRLYAFGSVLGENFSESSDIDLLVDFDLVDPLVYADNYFGLKFALEDTFRRSVDLLEEKAMKNPYFKKEVENQRRLIYGI